MALLALERLDDHQRAWLAATMADADTSHAPVLVGGAVRDALLRRRRAPGDVTDVDVAVTHGALELGRRIAGRLGAAFVVLDDERGAARVVTPAGRLDLTDWRAPTLEGDLAARDFTVNALAVSVPELLTRGRAAVVDPTGGLRDLRARRLRPAGAGVLAADPVRALRGVRLEFELGLSLTPATARAIRAVAGALARVAPERVRDELATLLRLPSTGAAVRRLDALGLLTVIVPEIEPMRRTSQPAPHRFTVLEHSIRAVEAADRLLPRLTRLNPHGDELARHVREPVGGGLERGQVLKLAALLHDVAKPETRRRIAGRVRFFEHDVRGAEHARAIGERLRLPERAVSLLERLVRHHLRPMHLAQAGTLTRRARYRFFRDLGADARDLLLLALVDGAAVTGMSPLAAWRRARVVRDLLAGVDETERVTAAPPLISGHDVMARFGLAPGPAVGALLRQAREAQDLGLVRTGEEALAWLARLDSVRAHS